MTQLPKWIADTVVAVSAPWLYTARVSDIQRLSGDIRQIRFTGDFSKAGFQPGQEVKFRVDDHHFRHYTLSAFDTRQNACEIIVYCHDQGPGSRWAAGLQTGDTVRFSAERGKLRYQEDATHHFFFGDETTIGLFNWFKRMALAADREYFGVLELHSHNECALQQLRLLTDAVTPLSGQPASPAIHWMEDMDRHCWQTWQKAVFYLAGRVASIQRFRRYLLDNGVPSRQIRTAPYWADGKAGL